MDALFGQLRKIAETASRESSVETCWILNREVEGHSAGTIGDNVYVLLRFRSRAAYELYKSTGSRTEWTVVSQLAVKRRATTWEETGIGFLGR